MWGRQDCPSSPSTDTMYLFPNAEWTGQQVMDYFAQTFQFNPREVGLI